MGNEVNVVNKYRMPNGRTYQFADGEVPECAVRVDPPEVKAKKPANKARKTTNKAKKAVSK